MVPRTIYSPILKWGVPNAYYLPRANLRTIRH
jgi:hypothetical protein